MTTQDTDNSLRTQLSALVKGGQAHAGFDAAVKGLPVALRGKIYRDLPYSAWQIVEHIRIAQRDILDFSRNRNPHLTRTGANKPGPYQPMNWPADYWPKSPAPPTGKAWTDSIRQIRADRAAFLKLLNTATPEALHLPFPWAYGKDTKNQTLLRSALLIADHTAYHTGGLILLRRLLGAWKK